MRTLSTIVIAIGLCISFSAAKAQNIDGKISGKITDSAQQPVSAATISLRIINKPKAVKYEVSATDGSFSIEWRKAGSFIITITAIGYNKYESSPFSIDSLQPQIILPPFIMKKADNALEAVTVTSRKSFIEQRVDRTIVNVDAMINSGGSTALDVLEKAPGVMVDPNGGISLKGHRGVAIYIDGRPSYLSGQQLQSYLQSLPATVISQLELMSNPSSKYDAAGTAGIINIKTVKQKMKGFNLGVTTGMRITKYFTFNSGLDFNYRNNRFNFFGNMDFRIRNSFNDIDIHRRYTDDNGNTTGAFEQKTYIHRTGNQARVLIGTDFYASQKTTIGLVLNRNMRDPNSTNSSTGTIYDEHFRPDSSLGSNNNSTGTNRNASVNLSVKHDFYKNGPSIQTNFDYLEYNNYSSQVLATSSYSPTGALRFEDRLDGFLPTDIKIYSGKADYERTIAAKWHFETGVKTSYTKSSNIANYFNVMANVSEPDYDKTNHFKYEENINAAYVNLNRAFNNLTIQAGVRYEGTLSKGHQMGNVMKPDSAFNRSYNNLFPTLFLLYKLDTLNKHQFKFNYGRRIDRPYYQDLNPFITPLDKLTFYVGNPYIKPAFTSKYELGYIFKNQITTTVNYSDTRDLVMETIEISDQKYYSRPGNIGKVTSLSFSVNANYNPKPWFNFQLNGQMTFQHFKSNFYTGTLETKNQYMYAQALFQFKLKPKWTMQVDGNYTSKTTSAQFTIAARGSVNYSVSKVLSPKFTIKGSVTDIFHTSKNIGIINNLKSTEANFRTLYDSRAALITLSFRVGKRVEGQRKKIESGVTSEQNRVKD